MNAFNKKDLMASVVVFLVALPLCMGIALASGVSPAQGIVTGVVGGIVAGLLAGAPLQVSGPAAGLTVLVYEIIQNYGVEYLGIAVLGAGLLQFAAGKAGLGRAFQAVSPAVIKGMLAGIGILILSSQFHVMVDDKPRGGGLANLLSIPEAIQKGLTPADDTAHHLAALAGLLTLVTIILWEKFKPSKLSLIPAPLVAIVLSTIVVAFAGWNISFVAVPSELGDFVNLPKFGQLDGLSLSFFFSVVALAFIASAETLLCTTATDAMHDGERADYNKELKAQGIGNMVCGVLGALPMTGVIVRSSANIKAGGETRSSAVWHGIWLAAFVLIFPSVLAYIPTASLAAILVYIGYKLVDVQAIKNLNEYSRWEVAIYAVTVTMIVTTDLLTGVLAGIGLAVFRTVYSLCHLDVRVDEIEAGRVEVMLTGAATFISLPKISGELEKIGSGRNVLIHLDKLLFLDHACLERLKEFQRLYERQGGTVEMEWTQLAQLTRDDKLRLAV
ncbi:MAG: SulP family inorganic anion transporter [Candidatus Eremiobacteraeota bacterium]|nr:SulP family inorganic anion transporter [Candidatus Eremiobacteraeota bacterium]